jgi:hypothetical protein
MSFVNQRFLFLDTRPGRWLVHPGGWRIRAAVAPEDYYCFALFVKLLILPYVMLYRLLRAPIDTAVPVTSILMLLQASVLSSEIFFSSLTLTYMGGVGLLNRHSLNYCWSNDLVAL